MNKAQTTTYNIERINQIKTFINEWKNKTPYLQHLTKHFADDVSKELYEYKRHNRRLNKC